MTRRGVERATPLLSAGMVPFASGNVPPRCGTRRAAAAYPHACPRGRAHRSHDGTGRRGDLTAGCTLRGRPGRRKTPHRKHTLLPVMAAAFHPPSPHTQFDSSACSLHERACGFSHTTHRPATAASVIPTAYVRCVRLIGRASGSLSRPFRAKPYLCLAGAPRRLRCDSAWAGGQDSYTTHGHTRCTPVAPAPRLGGVV